MYIEQAIARSFMYLSSIFTSYQYIVLSILYTILSLSYLIALYPLPSTSCSNRWTTFEVKKQSLVAAFFPRTVTPLAGDASCCVCAANLTCQRVNPVKEALLSISLSNTTLILFSRIHEFPITIRLRQVLQNSVLGSINCELKDQMHVDTFDSLAFEEVCE